MELELELELDWSWSWTSALLIGAQYARQGGMLASMKDWHVNQYDTIIQTVKSWNSQKDMPECNVALECLLEKLQQQAATSTPVAALTDTKVDEILRQNSEVFQLTEPLSRMWITDMLKSGRQALDDLQRGKSVDVCVCLLLVRAKATMISSKS